MSAGTCGISSEQLMLCLCTSIVSAIDEISMGAETMVGDEPSWNWSKNVWCEYKRRDCSERSSVCHICLSRKLLYVVEISCGICPRKSEIPGKGVKLHVGSIVQIDFIRRERVG